MKKILVGVDESQPAAHAARVAAELAKQTGSTLTLAYVSMPVLLPPVPYEKVIQQITADEHKHVTEFLSREKAALASFNITVDTVHLTGAPAETFVDLAENQDVWLVVVGSRGRSGVSRVLLGSFADRVVHICKKPVLVVR